MAPEVVGVEVDPAVERGGVVVESDLGRVDARLDAQLEALRRALTEEPAR
jgi:flagellar biosynthesis/type III secretory pathway protein FliH